MMSYKKILSLLSLLVIPGILLMPYFNEYFKIIPILMCLIGGISFGGILKIILFKE